MTGQSTPDAPRLGGVPENRAQPAFRAELNTTPRAMEVRRQNQERYGIWLNIGEDIRYQQMAEQERERLLRDNLADFQQRYRGRLLSPQYYLEEEAKMLALGKFEQDFPEQYKLYAKHGRYFDSEGNPAIKQDHFYTKLIWDADNLLRQRLLSTMGELRNTNPEAQLEALAKAYRRLRVETTREVYSAFRKDFPEKLEFYDNDSLFYLDEWFAQQGNNISVDVSARDDIHPNMEEDLGYAIHRGVVMVTLGADAPAIKQSSQRGEAQDNKSNQGAVDDTSEQWKKHRNKKREETDDTTPDKQATDNRGDTLTTDNTDVDEGEI